MADTASEASPWRPRVTVAALVQRDDRWLLVEELDAAGNPVINQPAGHLEAGESLIDAVRRETLEETGWHFEPRELVGVYRWGRPDGRATYLRFAFSGAVSRQEPDRELDRGILRALWLSTDELQHERARHRSPLVMACVRDCIHGVRYPLDCLHDIA
jgi:ADP-ribose pyrophosphatase YjhB (NUDIX family)